VGCDGLALPRQHDTRAAPAGRAPRRERRGPRTSRGIRTDAAREANMKRGSPSSLVHESPVPGSARTTRPDSR
jgi:hypothetical protein